MPSAWPRESSRRFAHPFLLDGIEVFRSTSIGIALTTPDASAETVLQNADIAMYRAKNQGKSCSELFDRAMHEQVMNRLLLEAKLRYALQNEELALHYQPIVAVETGECRASKHCCDGSRPDRIPYRQARLFQ